MGRSGADRKRLPISALVLTKNEEEIIGRTCRQLHDFDQVVVVDSHSTDATKAIAEEAGALVLDFEWNGGYPKKKQWSLSRPELKHNWVLFVDADEYPSEALIEELRALAPIFGEGGYGAYDIPLSYHFLGSELKYGHKVTKRALVDRRFCRFPVVDDLCVANMWEVEGHYQPECDSLVGNLKSKLKHDDIDPLYDYFARHNRYSDWEAHVSVTSDRSTEVSRYRSSRGRRYASIPGKPILFFLYSYIMRAGFLDGRAGLHYAIAHAFYFWQIGLKSEELRRGKT